MKMHKLVGSDTQTYCRAWIGFTRDGRITGSDGYYASRWWKYVTCKKCLKARRETSK